MDACVNCPYKAMCVFDESFPCFLDDVSKVIILKGSSDEAVHNSD